MPRLTRRRFIKGSLAAAGTTVALGGTRAPGQALGANDRIRVAVAGINGRGKDHIGGYLKMDNVEIACLVDPDSRLFGSRAQQIEEKSGKRPKCVQDVREALDDKSIHAVSIATPNFWHSLMTIWACQAGKDVYVEKPMSHNVHEGRVAVEMARKHNRIVQHGTQSRSDRNWRKAVAAIKSGKLGKLKLAHGFCHRDRPSIGFKPYADPPKELDYSMWAGPVMNQSYHENMVHYNWHWFCNTGNGDIGNQGVHQMDIGRWGIPGATLPDRVISVGGRYGYIDQATTANTQVAVMYFGDVPFIFEVRGLPTEKYRGVGVGNIFELEAGTIIQGRFYPTGSNQPAELPDVDFEVGPGDGNYGNFIAAMRTRKISDLNADVLEGHYSSALGHLCNVSQQLSHKVPFKPRADVFAGNDAAQDALERMEAHLAEGNKLNLDEMVLNVGRELKVDVKKERIVGDPEANLLLTRFYRKGFELPDVKA